ncbi:MAG: hypothetical protein KAJ31_07605 [Deltaproteobacteria bacterium]|nr:hypothetical protein [Deltaproteobacteria bacterium]MCK5710699.1 hypothetical protein [Deltaproteobacteria bacterium]
MSKTTTSFIVFILLFAVGINVRAAEPDMTTAEFRQLYNSLLAGKTLSTTTEKDGVTIVTERRFGQLLDLAEDDFDIPVQRVITKTKDGKQIQKITVDILDRVNNLGDSAIIYEEARGMVVENPDGETLNTNEGEFLGMFRIAKNQKGGFDVHNFGLIPSVVVRDGKNELTGSNISFSCFAENNLSKCVLTIRDYNLGDYDPLVGYQLKDMVGGEYVEIAEETK